MGNEKVDIEGQAVTVIEDSYILAAMVTFDASIRYYPVIDSTGRVAFNVVGSSNDLLKRVYGGESAPLSLYMSNLKMIRSAIFSLKNRSRRHLDGPKVYGARRY